MKLFFALIFFTQSVYGAAIWPNGSRLQTFQNGFLFGNGQTIDSSASQFTFGNGAQFNGVLTQQQQSTPSTPTGGSNRLYFKSDDQLYKLNSSAEEINVSSVVGGGQQQSGAAFGTINVPNQQVVRTATGVGLLETGNKNLLLNGGFEHQTYTVGWTTSGTATYSAETSAPLAGLKSFRAVASAQTVDLLQDTTLYASARAGSQMFWRFSAKNTAAGVTACVRLNGVKQTGSSSCLALATDNVTRTYELAFLANGTSNGIEIDAASTTGTLIVDDVELSTESSSFIDVAQIGPWIDAGVIGITAVTSNPTKGTIVQDKLRYRRNGENLELNYEYQQTSAGGAAGSGGYLLAIPSGFTIDTNLFPANTTLSNDTLASDRVKVGEGVITQNAAQCSTLAIYVYDSTRLYAKIGQSVDCTTVSSSSVISGDAWGSGNYGLQINLGVRINASVKVQGLSNKVSTYSQACVRDVDCENVFSADVSSTGVVSSENLDFINGNCTFTGTGVVNCPFISNLTTVPMSCSISTTGSSTLTRVTSVTTAAVFGETFGGTFTLTNLPFKLTCIKSAPDFKAKNVITGTFQNIEKCADPYECTDTFSAAVNTSAAVSNENLDFIATCSGTTTKTCNFVSGVFSVAPNCAVTPSDTIASGNVATVWIGSTSSTSIVFHTANGVGTVAQNYPVTIVCQKQGVDFKPKTAVAGSFLDAVTSPGAGRPVLCSAKVGITGALTDQVGGCFSSCTNANPRVCTFNTNFWSGVPNCQAIQFNNTASGEVTLWVHSNTTLSAYTTNSNGANSQQAFNVQCHGIAQ